MRLLFSRRAINVSALVASSSLCLPAHSPIASLRSWYRSVPLCDKWSYKSKGNFAATIAAPNVKNHHIIPDPSKRSNLELFDFTVLLVPSAQVTVNAGVSILRLVDRKLDCEHELESTTENAAYGNPKK